ncbi:hypothetical protein KKHLCK_11620 [Candidatus Electrothrix laxa]
MSDFTYQKPDEKKFLVALKQTFQSMKRDSCLALLNCCASMEITSTGDYARRWNAYKTYVVFRTTLEGLSLVTEELKEEILQRCDTLMPAQSGLEIVSVDFSPDLELVSTGLDPEEFAESLVKLTANFDVELAKELLPSELIDKGKELSNIYNMLFLVENSLRRFVDKVLRSAQDDNYIETIELNTAIRKNIKSRKNQEEKDKWIRVRGDSDIFYLDFIDIKFLIVNNWNYFKAVFPDQAWISVKIDELYKCRCLIAHNSDIGSHEIDVIRTNYLTDWLII